MNRWHYLVALFLLATSFALTAARRGLFEPDESRYALVAQGMLQEGHWLVPFLEGQPYTHKPPLYLWLVAIARGFGLSWTLSGVLPAFAAAMALLLWLPSLSQKLGLNLQQGYAAATTLAASPLFATMALAARMDMLLTLALTVAWVSAFVLLTEKASHPGPRRRFYWLFWLSLGFAVLSKGPVALALMAGSFILFRLSSPQPLPWRALFAGAGWPVGLGLVLAWYLPAALTQGQAWVMDTLLRQSAGRMVSSFAHKEPFYFHILTWPFTGFPSSCLALAGAVALLRKKQPAEVRFLAASFLSVLGFFSLISGKLVVYLLPLVPLSVLLAIKAMEKPQRWQLPAVFCSAVVGLGLAVAVMALPWWRPELSLTPWVALACGAGLGLGASMALLKVRKGQSQASFGWMVAGGLWFTGLVLPVVTGALNERLTVQALAKRYAALAPESHKGLVFREFLAGLPLYSGKPFQRLVSPEEVTMSLERGLPVVVTEKDAQKLSLVTSRQGFIVERFPYRRSALLIVYPQGNTTTP